MRTTITFLCVLLLCTLAVQAQTTLIGGAINNGNFENGTVSWSFVNDNTNKWQVSTAGPSGFGGTQCAYISNGATAPYVYAFSYSPAQTSYLYQDITFPAGETDIRISYKLNVTGSSGNTAIGVYVSNGAPTGTPPTGSNPIPLSLAGYSAVSGSTGTVSTGGSWFSANRSISPAQAGNASSASTRRILFVWQNASFASAAAYKPLAIDEVVLTSQCMPPTANAATGITDSTADISWAAVAGATGYNMRYRKTADPVTVATWVTPVAVSGSTAFHFSNLVDGTGYIYQVQAAGTGCSSWSQERTFQTISVPRSFTSVASGNWGDTATWNYTRRIPGHDDTVTIAAGTTVTEAVHASCSKLTVNAGGTFDLQGFFELIGKQMSISGTLNNSSATVSGLVVGGGFPFGQEDTVVINKNSGGLLSVGSLHINGNPFAAKGAVVNGGGSLGDVFLDAGPLQVRGGNTSVGQVMGGYDFVIGNDVRVVCTKGLAISGANFFDPSQHAAVRGGNNNSNILFEGPGTHYISLTDSASFSIGYTLFSSFYADSLKITGDNTHTRVNLGDANFGSASYAHVITAAGLDTVRVGNIFYRPAAAFILGDVHLKQAPGTSVIFPCFMSSCITGRFIITNGAGAFYTYVQPGGLSNLYPIAATMADYTAGYGNQASIGNAAGATAAWIGARVVSGFKKNGNTGPDRTDSVVARTWYLEQDGTAPINLSVNAYWYASHELAGFNRNNGYLYHYTGGIWDTTNTTHTTGLTTNGSYYFTRSNLSSLSPFGVGSFKGIGLAPLPVQLLSFMGSSQGSHNRLQWEVTDEKDLYRYELERSADGRHFSSIGNVPATGMSRYSYDDNAPLPGDNYYRLKMSGGGNGYSHTIVLGRDGRAVEAPALFPNPAGSTVTITGTGSYEKVQVQDPGGHTVQEFTHAAAGQLLNIGLLSPGTYIVRLVGKGGVQVLKMVRQ